MYSNYSNYNRVQLDIPLLSGPARLLPSDTPGKLSGQDIVQFVWTNEVDPSKYSVVVESMDTSGPRYRKVGRLTKALYLPFVQFANDSKIFVLPESDEGLPKYVGRLNRGSLYTLAPGASKTGYNNLIMSGVLTAGI